MIRDYVLSPAELALPDAQLAAMNRIIQAEAAARGFAYFSLSPLYEQAAAKAPFDPVALLTVAQPYGPYISLDGLHPSAEGARVLAETAARAINAAYGTAIPTTTGALPLLARR